MIFCLVVLASLSLTQAAKTICCSPAQWHANMMQMGGNVVLATNTPAGDLLVGKIFSDSKSKKVALTLHDELNNKKLHIIQDYNTMKRYTTTQIDNLLGTPCKVQTLDGPFPLCFPSNSQFVGSYNFGPKVGGLPVDVWNTTVFGLNVTVVLDSNTCMPVTEAVNGITHGVFIESGLWFSDVTLGLPSDMAAFILPRSCSTGTPVGRRSFFAGI